MRRCDNLQHQYTDEDGDPLLSMFRRLVAFKCVEGNWQAEYCTICGTSIPTGPVVKMGKGSERVRSVVVLRPT